MPEAERLTLDRLCAKIPEFITDEKTGSEDYMEAYKDCLAGLEQVPTCYMFKKMSSDEASHKADLIEFQRRYCR